MKRTTIILGIIFFALSYGCSESHKKTSNDQYILNGELEGIENGTWISLMLNDKTIDSTQVLDGKFSINGKLEQPKQFNLYIKNPQNYTQIWLEPKTINFKAKNGEFTKAEITGSKTQDEQEILSSSLKDYRSRRDSLTAIYRNPKSNDSLKKSTL